ncbi:MAG: sigma-70 family RNA polymerase sigma factor [Taibaiella sp.]|nr:sigma-70 family RNA polymerase sigma factor [Taibaiella sp.]
MPELLEAELTTLLRKNDTAAFKRLYDDSYPAIAAYVVKNSGNEQDAEDTFQEAMLILVQNLRKPGFVLTSSAGTYLYSVSRNIWLKRLRDNNTVATPYEEDLHGDLLQESGGQDPNHRRHSLLDRALARITSHCRHLLINIFLDNEPMERLMKRMGWKNKHTAANQKYKCLEQVKKVAAADAGLQ